MTCWWALEGHRRPYNGDSPALPPREAEPPPIRHRPPRRLRANFSPAATPRSSPPSRRKRKNRPSPQRRERSFKSRHLYWRGCRLQTEKKIKEFSKWLQTPGNKKKLFSPEMNTVASGKRAITGAITEAEGSSGEVDAELVCKYHAELKEYNQAKYAKILCGTKGQKTLPKEEEDEDQGEQEIRCRPSEEVPVDGGDQAAPVPAGADEGGSIRAGDQRHVQSGGLSEVLPGRGGETLVAPRMDAGPGNE
ncbi:unnamed protein product [Ranitomeya imitator]|uniref:Uncharacterized protein n=1 Tax=Ranitomeya imitator TaxID=111125 RepID=A0ABN9M901_9NEOB|nr:unnamed protein product [Ranitomeya imitator]